MGEIISLADQLKAKREERGISQSQAARELDVARTAYRLWEMEAARPAPDRWRLVARWLGVSVTMLMLSEGLLSDEEADEVDAAAIRYESATGEAHDEAIEREAGDFFEQGQTFIDRSLANGLLSPEEAGQFRKVLRRIQEGLSEPPSAARKSRPRPRPEASSS